MRKTAEQMQQLDEAIRSKLAYFMTPAQIVDALEKQAENEKRPWLKIGLSEVNRRLAILRVEDQGWLREQAQGSFTSLHRSVLTMLEKQMIELMSIRQNALKPGDKIEATRAIAEIAVKHFDLVAGGPTVMAVEQAYANQTDSKVAAPKLTA